MFPIQIAHKEGVTAIGPGGHFARPRDTGFRDTAAADLESLVAEIDAGRPWRECVDARYAQARPWLHRIITDPCRTAFLDSVLPLAATPVLDIGAGWGQVARLLARNRDVVALEPVAERLAFIRAAARQDRVDGRMAYLEADYFDVTFESRFSAVTAIGVLEWAGAFQGHANPQELQLAFLRKAKQDLAPGGCLILGIENRLGLKYLLGCPDDHLGVPHIGCLPAELAAERWAQAGNGKLLAFTYSHSELRLLLLEAGFNTIDFYAAFPDYKVSSAIVPFGENGEELNGWLKRNQPPPEHNGYDGSPLGPRISQQLGQRYGELARQGVAHEFVPSFFVRAC